MNDRMYSITPASWLVALVALAFVATAGAADPVADGLSEERTGVVERIDARGGLIVVGGQTFQLVKDQNAVLERILSNSTTQAFDESVRTDSINAGDRIRYAVDIMSEKFGDGEPSLLVLGLE